MSTRVLKFGLASFLLILMIVLVIALVRPIRMSIRQELQKIETTYLNLLEEKTGLSISYQSLSPSILSGIRLSGIEVYDSESETLILTVNTIKISYSLLKLISGDVVNAVRSITIDSLDLNWNYGKHDKVLDKIITLFAKNSNGNENVNSDLNNSQEIINEISKNSGTLDSTDNSKTQSEKEKKSIFDTELNFPFPVTLKNTHISYIDTLFSVSIDLPSLKIKSKNSSDYTSLETNGSITFSIDSSVSSLFAGEYTTLFKIQAGLSPKFDGSFARFQIKNAIGSTFDLSALDFAITYNNNMVICRFFSIGYPFELSLMWDDSNNRLIGHLTADNFDPFSLITIKSKDKALQNLKGSSISGQYILSYDNSDKSFSYSADGSVVVSKTMYPGGITTTVDVLGDNKNMDVKTLSIVSDMFNISYQGIFDFENVSPEGELVIEKVVLPSGKFLEGTMYLDRLSEGFVGFMPQLFIGDSFLTALELTCVPKKDSVDFAFEVFDYTHYEYDSPGRINIDGSLLLESSPYLQTGVSIENLFADSVLKYIGEIVEKKDAPSLSLMETLSPYIMSADLYASTDFKSISYNFPYAIIANTEKDNEMMLASIDGNETTIQVSRLNLLYGGQEFNASFSADATEDYSQIFFASSFSLNSIPYSFSGVYSPKNYVNVTGDYGFNVTVNQLGNPSFSGTGSILSLPISINGYLFSISFDGSYNKFSENDWNVFVDFLEISENSGKIPTQPSLSVAGSFDKYGSMLDNVVFRDSHSTLAGYSSVQWDYKNSILESASFALAMTDTANLQTISVDLSAANPFKYKMSDLEFWDNFFTTGILEIKSLSTAHFIDRQERNNSFSANISMSGSVSQLYVVATIPESSIRFNGNNLNISGSIEYENDNISVSELSLSYSPFSLKKINASFSIKELQGSLNALLDINTPLLSLSTPVKLDFNSYGEISPLSIFDATVILEKIESSAFKTIENYKVSIQRTPNRFDLIAGTKGSIKGWLLDSGQLYVSVPEEFPIVFLAEGTIKNNNLDIQVSSIESDLSYIGPIVSIPQFAVYKGLLKGNLHLGGLLSDPEFTGDFNVSNFSIGVPDYLNSQLNSSSVDIIASQNIFEIKDAVFAYEKTKVDLDLILAFDRWGFDSLDIHTATVGNGVLPAKFDMGFASFAANAGCDLQIVLTLDSFSLSGSVSTEDTIGVISLANLLESNETSDSMSVLIDLTINIGPKAQVYYPSMENPIVRGLASAQTPLRVMADSSTGTFSFKGDLILRGGEIIYLNRNFYLREGRIVFNETESSFDPIITVRAEIRERDAYGEQVRITLSSNEQLLSNFNPTLSSDPNRSQEDILLLLGEVMFAESGSTAGQAIGKMAISGVDYLLQTSLFRQMENRLRDSLNFDIFSFRTQFLQQALMQALNLESEEPNIGNYFDNTTVYIGKYIGTTVYMDAMFRLVYDQNVSDNSLGKLRLQPEIGLELPTPFANIRWSFAPDLTSAQNLWVPNTSVSLSWKFTF